MTVECIAQLTSLRILNSEIATQQEIDNPTSLRAERGNLCLVLARLLRSSQ